MSELDLLRQIRDQLAKSSAVVVWESRHVWLSAQEMAELLGDVRARTLVEKAASGEIPGHKPPGSKAWRFNPREVSEAIWNQGGEGMAVVRGRAQSRAAEILKNHRMKAG